MQVAVDAAMDVCAMLVKDNGWTVEDDYHNVETLVEEDVFPGDLGKALKDLNGLRNAIIHKYNKFEEEEILDNLTQITDILQRFITALEEYQP